MFLGAVDGYDDSFPPDLGALMLTDQFMVPTSADRSHASSKLAIPQIPRPVVRYGFRMVPIFFLRILGGVIWNRR